MDAYSLATASAVRTDNYVERGKIGDIDLQDGCYTAAEVFRLAASDVMRTGRAREVKAMLQAGVKTVRQWLSEEYGCLLGEREYHTPARMTPDAADLREFLRMLR